MVFVLYLSTCYCQQPLNNGIPSNPFQLQNPQTFSIAIPKNLEFRVHIRRVSGSSGLGDVTVSRRNGGTADFKVAFDEATPVPFSSTDPNASSDTWYLTCNCISSFGCGSSTFTLTVDVYSLLKPS